LVVFYAIMILRDYLAVKFIITKKNDNASSHIVLSKISNNNSFLNKSSTSSVSDQTPESSSHPLLDMSRSESMRYNVNFFVIVFEIVLFTVCFCSSVCVFCSCFLCLRCICSFLVLFTKDENIKDFKINMNEGGLLDISNLHISDIDSTKCPMVRAARLAFILFISVWLTIKFLNVDTPATEEAKSVKYYR
jgi:hypothetical protein